MRTIKFRGKSVPQKEWIYGYLCFAAKAFGMPLDTLTIQEFNKDGGKAIAYRCIDERTIGQFTGLYDKNNNEIYEGDILVWGENDCKSQPMVVIFKHGSFGYTYIEDWFHSFAGNTNFTFNPLNTDVRFEIVGNIHDNPELLKGDKR